MRVQRKDIMCALFFFYFCFLFFVFFFLSLFDVRKGHDDTDTVVTAHQSY